MVRQHEELCMVLVQCPVLGVDWPRLRDGYCQASESIRAGLCSSSRLVAHYLLTLVILAAHHVFVRSNLQCQLFRCDIDLHQLPGCPI